MDWGKIFTKERIFFILIFSILTLIGYKINFSALVGAENQFFTFFQLFGPIGGAFLGPIFGAVSVLVAEVLNLVIVGKEFSIINIARLLPMIFAAFYFGSQIKTAKGNLSALIPIACMGLFILHPVGKDAWLYTLFWIIPLIAKFFPNTIFLRSLGSTFSAHAIGSVLWIYTVPMSVEAWHTLIPIVFVERIIFALGISVSFILMNTVLHKFKNYVPEKVVSIDYNYSILNFLKVRG